MRAFLTESNAVKRDEIAARQLDVLEKFRLPQERSLRLSDVKEMFRQMRDTCGNQLARAPREHRD
jgi:hypothetical protein